MNNYILNDLLKEYEQKRTDSIRDAENRKIELYKSNPKLQEIDNKLSTVSISAAKSILQNNSEETLINFKNEINNLKNEKEKILKSINISEDYLLPKYDCSICKDTGYILENNKNVMCNCLKQKIYDAEYNQKNINNIKNETFNNFNINLFSDKKDEIKYNSSLSPKENILYIKEQSEKFVSNFEDPETKNLIFSGGTGLGKTFLSNCIINTLLEKRKDCYVSNSPCYV